MLGMTAFFIESIWVGFDVILRFLLHLLKSELSKFYQLFSREWQKFVMSLQKPNQLLSLSGNLSYPANIKSYGLKIRRKNKHHFDKN
jgi:hypothetical protein